MRVGPFFKWYGSKWSGAKHYPAPLEGLPIFEPFAGGAGYSCNHAEYQVVLDEDNLNLYALWEWLIYDATADLIKDIPCALPVGTDIRTLGLNQGQRLLLKHWQRTNNVGDCWTISPWGDKPGQWTPNTRARVAEEISAIKHWELEMCLWDRPGTYFVDPPYMFNYKYGFPRTLSLDYSILAGSIRNVPAGSLVIACEAVCPKTGSVPDYLPFIPSHSQVTSRRKTTNNHHSKELVYVQR